MAVSGTALGTCRCTPGAGRTEHPGENLLRALGACVDFMASEGGAVGREPEGSQLHRAHMALGTRAAGETAGTRACLPVAQSPRTPAGWLRAQGHSSPSSCEMPSTDL